MTAAELLCMYSVSSAGSKLRLPEAEDLWHAVEAWGRLGGDASWIRIVGACVGFRRGVSGLWVRRAHMAY